MSVQMAQAITKLELSHGTAGVAAKPLLLVNRERMPKSLRMAVSATARSSRELPAT
jgi:hypothetical protein